MRLLANGLQISRFARNDSREVARNDSGERSAFRSRFAENSIAASSHCATMKERYHHQGVIPSAARDLYARRSFERCLSTGVWISRFARNDSGEVARNDRK